MPRGLVATEGNLAVVDFGRTTEGELTKRQLCAQFRRSPRWVEGKMREGMPSRLDGNRRMFSLSACREWLANQEKEAASA